MQQIEEDSRLNVNNAWRIAHDRKSWRALRPVAGQAVQCVNEFILHTCLKMPGVYRLLLETRRLLEHWPHAPGVYYIATGVRCNTGIFILVFVLFLSVQRENGSTSSI